MGEILVSIQNMAYLQKKGNGTFQIQIFFCLFGVLGFINFVFNIFNGEAMDMGDTMMRYVLIFSVQTVAAK